MPDPLLSTVELDDSTGMRYAKLQRWLRSTADNAGIGYTIGGLLSNIELDDSEGMRFAKLQRWLTVIASGIGGGGGSGINYSAVPASSSAAGTAGQIAIDGDYVYFATATNTWRRAPLSDW